MSSQNSLNSIDLNGSLSTYSNQPTCQINSSLKTQLKEQIMQIPNIQIITNGNVEALLQTRTTEELYARIRTFLYKFYLNDSIQFEKRFEVFRLCELRIISLNHFNRINDDIGSYFNYTEGDTTNEELLKIHKTIFNLYLDQCSNCQRYPQHFIHNLIEPLILPPEIKKRIEHEKQLRNSVLKQLSQASPKQLGDVVKFLQESNYCEEGNEISFDINALPLTMVDKLKNLL
ncbi:Uncharacterized protein QTN25_007993 [Entamoeba marina]